MTYLAPRRWLVMSIGCLECHRTSDVVATYDTLDEARSHHPDARLRDDMNDHPAGGDWEGSDVTVIYDLGE